MLSTDWLHKQGPESGWFAARPSGSRLANWRPWTFPNRRPGAATAAVIVLWAALIAAVGDVPTISLDPDAQIGLEAVSTFARFFGALVLLLFPADRYGLRLRWVGAGFLVLGLGSLVFGYLAPIQSGPVDISRSIWASVIVWGVSSALFAVGLVPARPPQAVSLGTLLALLALGALGGVAIAGHHLPAMSHAAPDARLGDSPFAHDLSALGWAMSTVPLGLSAVAAYAAAHRLDKKLWGNWLVLALVLLTGAQVHNLLLPTNYSPVFSSVNLLRLAAAAVVVLGGTMEFRRVAAERADLLAAERERSRQIQGLADTKSDVARMVAHELASPIATIRGFLTILQTGDLVSHERDAALAIIAAETERLNAFAADVRAIATVERDDFAVNRFPVGVSMLLADATAFAQTLPGNHPFACPLTLKEQVLADPERITQVLRNLVGNAAKYSRPGSPIEIRATRCGDHVRIEVADQGFGIHPDDVGRVFAKFARGREATERRIAGTGVGLFVSRRIVESHGSTLTVSSTLGVGSAFAFELEVARCR